MYDAFGILAAAGALYGLIGVLVGTILPRELEGSLVLVFMADFDNVLSSGLFDVGAVAAGHLVPMAAYLGVVIVAAFVAYAGGEAVRVGMSEVFPAFTTPMVAALLSAIAGLFLMGNAARADSRRLCRDTTRSNSR